MDTKQSPKDFIQSLHPDISNICELDENSLLQEELALLYPRQEIVKAIQDRYKILSLIGQGGMKSVYLAKDHKTDCNIALAKPRKSQDTKQAIEDFLKEAQICASLKHPNIIAIHDIGFIDNRPFFTMDFLGGKNLAEFISSEKIYENDMDTLFDIFKKICDAISYAHSAQILHLDLKPENIQIGDFSEVHVCDWGLAKSLLTVETEDIDIKLPLSKETLNGEIKGTLGFMAPEQVQSGEKDQRTDIFMLGGILYFMLTGRSPIERNDLKKSLKHTQRAHISSLQDNSKFTIDPGLESLIKKCLSREPSSRYKSVKELQLDFAKYRQGFATIAQNANFLTILKLFIQRYKKGLKISLAIALSFVVILIIFLNSLKENHDRIDLQNRLLAQRDLKLKQEQSIAKVNKQHLEIRKVERNSLAQYISDIYISQILEDRSTVNIHNSKNILQLIEEITPDLKKDKQQNLAKVKFILHFIRQEFQAAHKAAQALQSDYFHNRSIVGTMRKYAESYSKIKKDNEYLKHQDLAKLFYAMSKNHKIITSMYNFHIMRNIDFQSSEFINLVSIMINYNTGINHGHNTFKEVILTPDKTLDLSNRPIRLLRINGHWPNILEKIEIKKLDISHTLIASFDELVGLECETLDITGCPIKIFGTIGHIQAAKVKTIICDPSFLDPQDYKLLQENFNVIKRKSIP